MTSHTEDLNRVSLPKSMMSWSPCLFHHKNGLSTINIHVDDFLCTCKTAAERDRVHAFFKARKCTIQEQDIDFLHMHIERIHDGSITVDMESFINSHLDNWGVEGTAPYPAQLYLFDTSDDAPPARDPKRFTSILCSISITFDVDGYIEWG